MQTQQHCCTQYDICVPCILDGGVWMNIEECVFGDFEKGVDDDRIEYIELKVERGMKTHTGLEGQQDRAFNPRMYATGSERCPVKIHVTSSFSCLST